MSSYAAQQIMYIGDYMDRILTPIEDGAFANVPFNYDGNVLGSLREDQVPRFFGALTDSETLPKATFRFDQLTAMQNRVSVGKVEAIRQSTDKSGKLPVVVINNDTHYLADGHHRAAAAWLNGDDTFEARVKDISENTNAVKANVVAKVNDSLGLVFGWAIVSKINGEEYFDTQEDHIPEDVMLNGAAEFMEGDRKALDMHTGEPVGKIIFAWPVTDEIAKAMGIRSDQTGLMIASKPDSPAILEKYRSGAYRGFSIGGRAARHDA